MLEIGVDIVAVSRMRETLERSGNAFISKIFTEAEQECSRFHQDPAIYFAEVFAAKEAVFKTFSTDWEDDMSFLDIEVKKGASGEPLIFLYGRFRELLLRKKGKGVKVSLSWDEDSALAFAVMR